MNIELESRNRQIKRKVLEKRYNHVDVDSNLDSGKIKEFRSNSNTVNSAYNELFGTMRNSSLYPEFLINI